VFTGQEREAAGEVADPVEGMDYMHARYYSFEMGRFLSVDPVGGEVGLSQSWNRYAYVRGNPVTFLDDSGNTPKKPVLVWEFGRYVVKLIKSDTVAHGQAHYHVYKRGGKLLGRVSVRSGQVLTGSVPRSVLKRMIRGGLIGGFLMAMEAREANAEEPNLRKPSAADIAKIEHALEFACAQYGGVYCDLKKDEASEPSEESMKPQESTDENTEDEEEEKHRGTEQTTPQPSVEVVNGRLIRRNGKLRFMWQ
jgi:RHS repeat-associated protein